VVLAILLSGSLKKKEVVRQSHRGTAVSPFFAPMLSKLLRCDPAFPTMPAKDGSGASAAGPGQKCHLLLASSAALGSLLS